MQNLTCEVCPAGEKCALRASRPRGHENIPEPGLRILTFKKRQDAELTAVLETDMFILRRGAMKVSTDTGDIIRLSSSGDACGIVGRLSQVKVPHRLKSLGPDLEICALPWSRFEQLLHERPPLWQRVLSDLSTYALTMALVSHWAKKSLRERALLLLQNLAQRYGVRYGQFTMIDLPLTKIDIASMMGTVQESAVRVLSELREDGLTSSNGKRIVILDLERLDRLVVGIRERDQARARLAPGSNPAEE